MDFIDRQGNHFVHIKVYGKGFYNIYSQPYVYI